MTWMCLAVAAVSASALPPVTRPAPANWPYLIASAFLHLEYNLFLVRAYRMGELGEVYPQAACVIIAIGSSALGYDVHAASAHRPLHEKAMTLLIANQLVCGLRYE